MKTVLGFIGALTASVVVFLLGAVVTVIVSLVVSIITPEWVGNICIAIGLLISFICGLTTGFLIWRPFWREYSSSEPE